MGSCSRIGKRSWAPPVPTCANGLNFAGSALQMYFWQSQSMFCSSQPSVFLILLFICLPFAFVHSWKQRLSWHFFVSVCYVLLSIVLLLLEPPAGLSWFWALPPFSPQGCAGSQSHVEHCGVFHPLQISSCSGQLQLSQHVRSLV